MHSTEGKGGPKPPVIPRERGDDLHNLEIADRADLALFMAGNQFMAMPELIDAFQKKRPEIENIYYETLPPGLELKQILAGGAVFGGKTIEIIPDVYTSVNRKAMETMVAEGLVEHDAYRLYLHNRLSIMVPKGNFAGVRTVADLGSDAVRISQPDPENEDIAFHIMDMYRDAGGEELVRRIMEEKRAEGTTIMTVVHHRETPLRIRKKTVDAGPVWATEVIHAKSVGLPFEVVEPGPDLDQRDKIDYYACRLKNAPHPENAEKFMEFLQSEEAGAIYEKYGFVLP